MNILHHQKSALIFLEENLNRNIGCLLGDSAGTGKTLPALLASRANTPAGSVCLWVTLASAKFQIETEISRFHIDFTPIVLPAGKTARLNALQGLQSMQAESKPVLLVINYEQILTNSKDLSKLTISVIVADECTRLGNEKNKTYKLLYALARLRRAKLVALSGTPITNNPMEAWALFEYLNPGSLGCWINFALTYMKATPFSMIGAARLDRLPHLASRLQPYYLRREREVLLPDLPELMEETIPIEFSKPEQNLYNNLVMELLLDIEKTKLDRVENPHNLGLGIVKFGKLRQICVNAALLGSGNTHSAKLKALVEFVSTLNGNKALIFTEFAAAVPGVLAVLPAGSAVSITGSVPQSDRVDILEKFQTDAETKYLVMTRAGEMGLNLQAADFVIHLDPPLTYASYDQRCSRARRQGRKDRVVSVRLVIKDSIEEKIYKLIERKRMISLTAMPYNELVEELL